MNEFSYSATSRGKFAASQVLAEHTNLGILHSQADVYKGSIWDHPWPFPGIPPPAHRSKFQVQQKDRVMPQTFPDPIGNSQDRGPHAYVVRAG